MYKCKHLKIRLAQLIFRMGEGYGLHKEKRSLLISNVINMIHSGLSRCEHGNEAQQLSSATIRHEMYNQEMKSAKHSSLNPFRWGRD